MEELANFIAQVLEISEEKVTPETMQGEVDAWDSLAHFKLVIRIEEKYGVKIPMDKVSDIKSVADFYQYVK
jgi:Acyl carrier protein